MARSRKREKLKIRIKWQMGLAACAILVFVAAFFYYFMNTYIETEREYAVYSSIDEPTLPVIFVCTESGDINLLHGYVNDMGIYAAGDSISPLPEDRRLRLRIKMYGAHAAGMSYEIRSLDTGHFIENTTLTEYYEDEDGDTTVILPIQNLIKKDTAYLLKIKIETGEQAVNYYTRIIWPSDNAVYDIIRTAREFTEKSFDYETARDLTIYLETDSSADTSNLGTVDISSGYSQITWGSTGMELITEPVITVREYDGSMGAVEIKYFSRSLDTSGNEDFYYNTDNFTLRSGSERVYMMDFERKTNQIFNGNKHFFSGKRINLGITNEESLQSQKSPNRRYIAFKSGKEMWLYDQTDKIAVNLFSFRSETDILRASYDQHDIKIMSVSDDGITEFAVYGYINRGRHEGCTGIIYYRYDPRNSKISELFFMPIDNTYEKIKLEIDELLIKSNTGMVYIKQNEAVTAIDLTSLEMLDVVSDLTGGRYAISDDQTEIAWIEGERYMTNSIKLMDVMTGNTQTIGANSGEILTVIGFYNNDLIYGISRITDINRKDGRIMEMPLKTVIIADASFNTIMEYSKEGLYFDDIYIDNDRIHIGQYRLEIDSGRYRFAGRDTIVCSEEREVLYLDDIASDNNEIKKRIYYIELDENIKTTRTLDVISPDNISYENAGTIELKAKKSSSVMRYYAYSGGRLKGMGYTLRDAMDIAYENMGWIKDDVSSVIYARADRGTQRTLQDPISAAGPVMNALENEFRNDIISDDGYIIMDAYGIQLNRLLYYVYKGYPVLALLDDGEYCLIYGYTSDSIYVYYPSDDEGLSSRETFAMDDAAMYFDRFQNNFIVFRDYQGYQ